MSKLVFTQVLDEKLTYKNGSLKVYIGEDDNGKPINVTAKRTTKYDANTRPVTWTATNALFTGNVQGLPLTVGFVTTANVDAGSTGRIVNDPAQLLENAKKEEGDNDPNLSSAAKAKVDTEANKARSMDSLPPTGDTTNILPLLGVMLLALGSLLLRRKKDGKTN